MDDTTFYKLSLTERMEEVDERMGGAHPDRISTVQDLIDLRGETAFVILSPFGQEQNIGNGFIYEWKIGNVTTPDRTPVTTTDDIDLDDVKLICEFLMNDGIIDGHDIREVGTFYEEIEVEEYQAISIKDFNVIPNNHNNHGIFSTLDGAEAYAIYRKLKWSEDENLTEIRNEYPFWIKDDEDDKSDTDE